MPRVVPSQIVDYLKNIRKFVIRRDSKDITVDKDTYEYLFGVICLIDELPNDYLRIDGSEYCDFVVATTSIANAVKMWRPTGGERARTVSPVRGVNALKVIIRALEKCSDAAVASTTTELPFIKEEDIRDSIRTDLSSATTAAHNAEWKAATVLAGSVCEALLLWAIPKAQDFNPEDVKSRGRKPASLERLDLTGFIELAAKVKIITTGTSSIANRARDYRNLIHPGRAERTKHACDRATALRA